MLTRAKFLRLSGLTAAALVVAPEALPKSSDGVVRVKSVYSFQETIERLKKDIAAKGIRSLAKSTSPSSPPMPVSSLIRRRSWCSVTPRSAPNL